MPVFADIHNHSLYGIDDGAKTREQAEAMIAASYAEGVRLLCLTPHHHASYYTSDPALIQARFSEIAAWAEKQFPDLRLFLGSEVFGYSEGLLAVQSGAAFTLAGGSVILFEFRDTVRFEYIRDRLAEAQALGYTPALAHAERYGCLYGNLSRVEELVRRRAYIQINASSLTKRFRFRERRFVKKLLKKGLVSIVASDAHNMVSRPPALRSAYDFVSKHYGERTADRLFYENAYNLLMLDGEKEKL